MGLIAAGLGPIGGVLADQWKEFFYCDTLPPEVIVARGYKQNTKNNKGNDNVITNLVAGCRQDLVGSYFYLQPLD